jgi:hypothetical protein
VKAGKQPVGNRSGNNLDKEGNKIKECGLKIYQTLQIHRRERSWLYRRVNVTLQAMLLALSLELTSQVFLNYDANRIETVLVHANHDQQIIRELAAIVMVKIFLASIYGFLALVGSWSLLRLFYKRIRQVGLVLLVLLLTKNLNLTKRFSPMLPQQKYWQPSLSIINLVIAIIIRITAFFLITLAPAVALWVDTIEPLAPNTVGPELLETSHFVFLLIKDAMILALAGLQIMLLAILLIGAAKTKSRRGAAAPV